MHHFLSEGKKYDNKIEDVWNEEKRNEYMESFQNNTINLELHGPDIIMTDINREGELLVIELEENIETVIPEHILEHYEYVMKLPDLYSQPIIEPKIDKEDLEQQLR